MAPEWFWPIGFCRPYWRSPCIHKVARGGIGMKASPVFVGIALMCACGTVQAQLVLDNNESVSLDVLLAGDGMFIVGDKLFKIESWSNSAGIPPASEFVIQGFIAGGPGPYGLPNIGFDLIGPFGDGTPGDLVVHEYNLQYTVEILPAFAAMGYRITDNVLTFNGAASGEGSFARVDETVFDFFGNTLLGEKSVFDIVGPPHETQLQDSLIWGLPGYLKLEINKDIRMFAATQGGTASASFIRQEFSQIPAPGAAALLGLGGLIAARRRR